MIGNYIDTAISILYQNILVVLLMVILTSLCFVVVGKTCTVQKKAETTATEHEEKYGKNSLYWTAECFNDKDFYTYLSNNSKYYEKVKTFKNKLMKTNEFTYITAMDQPLSIVAKTVPDEVLDGYEFEEEGDTEASVNKESTECSVKAVEASKEFFEYFNITVSEGKLFQKEDFIYQKGKSIPVLLGAAYHSYFKVGDTFEAAYLMGRFKFKVKGFVEKEKFFAMRSVGDLVSCERYMFVPALEVNEFSRFSKALLLQQMEGMIVSKLGYTKTNELYRQFLGEVGLEKWDLIVVDPDATTSYNKIESYSVMTKQVARQFKILLIIIVIFACIAITMNMIGILKRQHYNFGVEMLCGASRRYIAMEAFGIAIGMVLVSDGVASLVLKIIGSDARAILIVQCLGIGIAAISCLASNFYLRKMNISDIIGGKE